MNYSNRTEPIECVTSNNNGYQLNLGNKVNIVVTGLVIILLLLFTLLS